MKMTQMRSDQQDYSKRVSWIVPLIDSSYLSTSFFRFQPNKAHSMTCRFTNSSTSNVATGLLWLWCSDRNPHIGSFWSSLSSQGWDRSIQHTTVENGHIESHSKILGLGEEKVAKWVNQIFTVHMSVFVFFLFSYSVHQPTNQPTSLPGMEHVWNGWNSRTTSRKFRLE